MIPAASPHPLDAARAVVFSPLGGQGLVEQAVRRIGEAIGLGLLEVGDRLYAAIYRAARGHVLIARGEDAGLLLDEVRRTAAELDASDESEIGIAIRALEGARAAAETGAPLFRGELHDGIPEGIRRWLTARGSL